MPRVPLRLIWAHLRANRLRGVLTVGSVAVAMFLFCTLQTILTSLEAMVGGSSSHRVVTSSAVSLFDLLPYSAVQRIRSARIPGVKGVGHWTWFDGIYRDPKEFFARFAVDVSQLRAMYSDDYQLTEDAWSTFERDPTACIIGRGLADRYDLSIGDSMALKGTIFPGDFQFTIVAVYSSDNPTYDEETMFFHWKYLNEAMGQIDRVGMIGVDIDDPEHSADICSRIDALFRNSSSRTLTQPEAAFSAQFLSMWGNVGLLFRFISGAVLFATFVITINTMLMAVNERVVEIGVLKTLGFRSRDVQGLYVLEAFVLCGGGTLAGTGLARLLWHGQPLRMATVILPEFVVNEATLYWAAILGLLLTALVGSAPALVASRTSIVKALRMG